ncbi:hypothetical protein PSP6_380023 [Paraburkholderia tropica]|nr:hypothetical protein PSP6_380023 [Paraburkholderia tropica]
MGSSDWTHPERARSDGNVQEPGVHSTCRGRRTGVIAHVTRNARLRHMTDNAQRCCE